MKSLSKPIRKLVREWCAVAYQRELGTELAKLHDHFRQWEAGTLNEFELSDAIHTFHDGPSRDLYGMYVTRSLPEDFLVATALSRDVLKKTELPPELLDAITPMLSKLEST